MEQAKRCSRWCNRSKRWWFRMSCSRSKLGCSCWCRCCKERQLELNSLELEQHSCCKVLVLHSNVHGGGELVLACSKLGELVCSSCGLLLTRSR